MKEILEEVFGQEGLISQKFKDYKVRESQVESIPIIWNSLKEGKHCLLEGPCGFGKTYVYLFPALMEAKEKGKRVIIATSGITLQDQLVGKDLPFMNSIIEEYTGEKIAYASLKGKNNYICKRACKELKFASKNMNRELSQQEKDIIELSEKSKIGDIDELGYVPSYDLWKDLNCSTQSFIDCKNCPFICFNKEARAKAEDAKVVVTNYHLLFSDIKVGRGILGEYDILICDEGHELPNVIRSCFEQEFSLSVVKKLKDSLKKIEKFGDEIDISSLNNSLSVLYNNSQTLFKLLEQKFATSKFGIMKNLKEFNLSFCKKELEETVDSLFETKDLFKGTIDNFQEDDYVDRDEKMMILTELENIYIEVAELTKFMSEKVNVESHDFDNEVVFFEFSNHKCAFKLRLKKVDELFYTNFVSRQEVKTEVEGKLFEVMFEEPNSEDNSLSIIITSATLSVGGNFDYIKEQLGFYDDIIVSEFIGKSPFNLTEQELWYLPYDAVEANKKGFEEVMLRNFVEVCKTSQGGVLGLFTSVYNMNQAYEHLISNLYFNDDIIVYKQGEYSRSNLIQKMRDKNNVVLIGTKSLFTGVDVVGSNLRVVFIDKFPFPNISDPVVKELSSEPGGFYKFSIPEMVISLKQAIGRGVRSVNDKCVICINDNRMATASYKRQVNKSFNYKKTATRDIQVVKDFLNS